MSAPLTLGALEIVLMGSTLGEPFGRWRMQWSKSLTPVQVLTPPRMLDELSGRVSQVAPAAINEHVRIWEKSVPPNAFNEYVRDFWERSVLFVDILRQRGNQREDMLAHRVTSVLIYDSELVMRRDAAPSSGQLLTAKNRSGGWH